MNDRETIKRCRNGDADAFRHIVERYQAEAMGHALAILGNREDAADAAQTAFIKAYNALPAFDTARRFYPWFYVILRNCCYKLAAARKHEMSCAFGELVEVSPAAGAPVCEEALQLLHAALARLTPKDRELITLKHLDRMSYRELSERLEIPPGTVMSRLYYARKRLRDEMEILETKNELS